MNREQQTLEYTDLLAILNEADDGFDIEVQFWDDVDEALDEMIKNGGMSTSVFYRLFNNCAIFRRELLQTILEHVVIDFENREYRITADNAMEAEFLEEFAKITEEY